MQKKNQWATHQRDEILAVLKKTNRANWGYDLQDNWGLVFDLEAMMGMPDYRTLKMKRRIVDARGIEIYATVEAEISSLSEVKEAVYKLLAFEAEDILIILPFLDQETIRYWFVTGDNSHGHIGEIIIRREDIPQIDLSEVDELWQQGTD